MTSFTSHSRPPNFNLLANRLPYGFSVYSRMHFFPQIMPSNNDNKIWKSLEQLNRAETAILRLLAVIYEPVTQTELKDKTRSELSAAHSIIGKSWFEKMQKCSLITRTGNRFACHRTIVNELAYQAFTQKEFTSHFRADSSRREHYWGYDDFHHNPWFWRKQLRNALFEGNLEQFKELLELKTALDIPQDIRASEFFKTAVPFPRAWTDTAPTPMLYQIFRYSMESGIYSLGNLSGEQKFLA